MAEAKVELFEIEPARAAVVEERVTLTINREEALGLLALVGKAQVQYDHPNSLGKVYGALSKHFPYTTRPRVVTKDMTGKRVHVSVGFESD